MKVGRLGHRGLGGLRSLFGTRALFWTTAFVFAGLWRYLYLVFKEGRGGRPHEILLNDLALQGLVVGWIVTFVAIIGVGERT